MSQRFAQVTGARGIAAASNSAVSAVSNTWRKSFVGAAANTATNKPSTHKRFAFAANYATNAAFAKSGSWSTIG
ncbi:MAG: hypothetical protein F2653_01225 [Actinobacteria bacterium]|uniref:Unannotated protein n=1 Tax=freshwater metagenome TaxID=449393 RepID=A0A6J6M4C6_9ZZZZ|nr:hypothetical protein [Actinomycetota bacterium]MSW21816.1 hypothetical protein [Actinomycetota bacterium]MSX03626.1 hypothetical protein [Actinomycetota bacterium]MSX83966.1 hypothetical protein [Actinomycetota bacterium]MSY96044.1 hypothetical protein [Actinomycetota bacterium]